MAVANSSYSFEITSTEKGTPNRRSGLRTFVISGTCTDKDGQTFNFVATNKLCSLSEQQFVDCQFTFRNASQKNRKQTAV